MLNELRFTVIIAFVLSFFLASLAEAIPHEMNYQGTITNASGTLLDGTYDMKFRFFNHPIDGNELWNAPDGEEQSVLVTDGIFNVSIGSVVPLYEDIFTSTSVYLEVAIYNPESSAWEILAPRQRLTSTAYAFRAADADTLNGFDSTTFLSKDGGLADLDFNNLLVQGLESFDNNGEEGILYLGDTNNYIKAVHGSGVRIGAFAADDALSVQDVTGNVGIGVTNPTGKLDVNGLITSTGAGLNGGLRLANPIGGNDFRLIQKDDGRLTITDETAAEERFIMDSNGNVGIGTNPATKLDVFGNIHASGALSIGSGTKNLSIFTDGILVDIGSFGSDLGINYPGNNDTVINVGGGNVGIGKPDPEAKLDVSSDSDIVVRGTATDTGAAINIGGYFQSKGASGRGVYGYASDEGDNAKYGGYFEAEGLNGRGVYGYTSGANGRGVYGYVSGSSGIGVYAHSVNGDALYASTHASNEHAGYFNTDVGIGLGGAAVYARSNRSDTQGIALWAHNDHTTSEDVTAVLSNDGLGHLLKGFGGNGGEDEFRFDNDGTLHIYNSAHMETILLDPSELGTTTGSKITLYNGAGDATIELDADFSGNGRVTTQELDITGGSDLSEQFDVGGNLEPAPGMLVSIDPDRPGKLQVSSVAYDRKVAGIISGAGGIKTGLMMGQEDSVANGSVPVALTGRVYCMADASGGTIQPGDLLTTSDVAGHAMKVTDHGRAAGAVIGKAMTALGEGKGLILVLVSLQ